MLTVRYPNGQVIQYNTANTLRYIAQMHGYSTPRTLIGVAHG